MTGDITKAFLQIKVHDHDQNALRFLWDDGNSIREMVFDRVPFRVVISTLLLNATIKYHLSKYKQTNTILELRKSLYVDDLLSGGNSNHEASVLKSELTEVMRDAGLDLAKWQSNEKSVVNSHVEFMGQ